MGEVSASDNDVLVHGALAITGRNWNPQMHKIIEVAVIAGVLATAHLAFADPLPISAPDHAPTTASATPQPAPAWSSSSNAPAWTANLFWSTWRHWDAQPRTRHVVLDMF
jgi:hypothetical protein